MCMWLRSCGGVACALVFWMVAGQSVVAAEPALPWHMPGWKFRQVVEIVRPDAEGKVNTGLIELDARPPQIAPDGRDIRLYDELGRAVKFQLVTEKREPLIGPAPAGEAFLVHFQMSDPAVRFYVVYFGNAEATAAGEAWDKKLGGLLLETRVNTARRWAENWADMGSLVGLSKWKYGEGLRRQINDSENPFGPNEQFISIYRGLLYCRVPGEYGFGTDSDDSSFLLIDGQLVAQAPRAHVEAGTFEKPFIGKIDLSAGMHKIEYYHVNTLGGSLARAGWKPPGATNFVIIPEEAFVRELRTEPYAVESRENPLSAFFKVTVVDSYQFGAAGPVFATVAFEDRSRSSLAAVSLWEWDLGDGTISREPNLRHVFVGGKSYDVTLRCMDSLGFESRHAKKVSIASTGRARVDVALEFAAGKPILLPGPGAEGGPGEALQVSVKCRVTGGPALPLNLVTLYRGADGVALARQKDAITLKPGEWSVFERSNILDGREAFATGELQFQVEHMDTVVAAGKVILAGSATALTGLRVEQEQLQDADGSPVVLRLSNEPYNRRLPPVAQKLKQGGDVRILVVDDSLAGSDGGYPDILAGRLKRRFPRANLQMVRIGDEVGSRGYQPLSGIVEFPQKAEELQADAVVVAASLRDVLRFMPVERFERRMQAVVDRLEAARGAEVVLVAPPPAIANPGLSQAYALAVKRIGLRRGVAVADAYSAFLRLGDGKGAASTAWRELYRDPDSDVPIYRIAPYAQGQELIAAAIERAIVGE